MLGSVFHAISTTHQVTTKIRARRSSYREMKNNKFLYRSPNELFQEFMLLAPLLPLNVSSWGLTLAHQYHSALSDDVKHHLNHRSKYYHLTKPIF
jgi:hypothetical protein